MPQPKGLEWTPKQREIRALIEQGKTHKEMTDAGYSSSQLTAVSKELQAEARKRKKSEQGSGPSTAPKKAAAGGSINLDPLAPRYSVGSLEPMPVGEIQILPENWHINQYGGLLILDTYVRAKARLGYEGTVGEFICDVMQLYRVGAKYGAMPDDYLLIESARGGDDGNGREETGEGSGGGEENGSGGAEELDEPDG